MILLVLEGQKEEPKIMATIKSLFFDRGKEHVLCSYGTDAYTLWKDIKEHTESGYDVDVFRIVKNRMQSRGDHSLDAYDSYSVDAIYMFFDYDPQNDKVGLQRLNTVVSELIEMFDDPMENGQIFISYPMAEALYYENDIPSDAFMSATVPLRNCRGFKSWANRYYIARCRNAILGNRNKQLCTAEQAKDTFCELKRKWTELVRMNTAKANLICNGNKSLPTDVAMITQSSIFQHELSDFVDSKDAVSILSAFPMFLFEYFHGGGDF